MIQRCNRCQEKFETPEMPRSGFWGSAAARVEEFATCPHCGQTDCHWVYASDIMPEFTGTSVEIKKLQKAWLNNN